MKQHLLGEQLMEINYEERLVLLSLVTGLEKQYLKEEYEAGKSNEEAMLRSYGYQVNIGELIAPIEDYTRQFPFPIVSNGKYAINISWTNSQNNLIELYSDYQPSYCDALYEIVKKLLKDKYIV
jgi:hypothetical protein